MILTRTPLRISLVGGGTDLPGFYKRSFGAVISFAINKYVYVGVNKKFDDKVRVSYSRTENEKHAMDLRHDIIREALLSYGTNGIEVVTVADIPGSGTGLGSSSSLAVGLSKALHKYTNGQANRHPSVYAEHGYHIEREMCLHHVGKQDHYAAAYGGWHYFQFNADDTVSAEPIELNEDEKHELENRFVLLWTGRARNAKDILKEQEAGIETFSPTYHRMRELAIEMRNELRAKDFSNIGAYMRDNWKLKKLLSSGISNPWIDEIYGKAIEAGAQGGKLCGAGGGGFFLFYGKLGLAQRLEKATGLKHIPFQIDTEGCRVLYG